MTSCLFRNAEAKNCRKSQTCHFEQIYIYDAFVSPENSQISEMVSFGALSLLDLAQELPQVFRNEALK